ncbi:MAG: hypothetical protein DMG04_20535 [Acidobacteria bacterium]|nr:MAG: hypothetical protein DMG04_20535 [Acidobacteriota bacterium]PYQ86223.1 MAG: hypothetical protein DMG03_07610 [Acidobacteriota bacterium]PYQ91880.1 MAG: hypothetical protein DMG02_04250 [Acidobacteriota bacterium]PYR06480.1 MAG: hypothetical protein DMF99_26015 [Acidobacteriota bacterium]
MILRIRWRRRDEMSRSCESAWPAGTSRTLSPSRRPRARRRRATSRPELSISRPPHRPISS